MQVKWANGPMGLKSWVILVLGSITGAGSSLALASEVCLYIPRPIVARASTVACDRCAVRTAADIDAAYVKLREDSWVDANRRLEESRPALNERCLVSCGKSVHAVVPSPACVTHALVGGGLELECTVTVQPDCVGTP